MASWGLLFALALHDLRCLVSQDWFCQKQAQTYLCEDQPRLGLRAISVVPLLCDSFIGYTGEVKDKVKRDHLKSYSTAKGAH